MSTQQISFSSPSSSTRPNVGLHQDVLLKIFSYLSSPSTVLSVRSVCQVFRGIIDSKEYGIIWQQFFEKKFEMSLKKHIRSYDENEPSVPLFHYLLKRQGLIYKSYVDICKNNEIKINLDYDNLIRAFKVFIYDEFSKLVKDLIQNLDNNVLKEIQSFDWLIQTESLKFIKIYYLKLTSSSRIGLLETLKQKNIDTKLIGGLILEGIVYTLDDYSKSKLPDIMKKLPIQPVLGYLKKEHLNFIMTKVFESKEDSLGAILDLVIQEKGSLEEITIQIFVKTLKCILKKNDDDLIFSQIRTLFSYLTLLKVSNENQKIIFFQFFSHLLKKDYKPTLKFIEQAASFKHMKSETLNDYVSRFCAVRNSDVIKWLFEESSRVGDIDIATFVICLRKAIKNQSLNIVKYFLEENPRKEDFSKEALQALLRDGSAFGNQEIFAYLSKKTL